MSKGFWPNFDQINISHRRPCSVWIVNLLTWQNAPEEGYDEKSWEMAYNWLMMTSSGDDNWSSGSLGLLTDKMKTRTAARFKLCFKNHGYSYCPTPSNAKYKESKWLWASQLGKCIVSKQWQFWCHRLRGFNPKVKLKLIKAHWHC